jgi:ATP-dependent Clp protease adaptor protein ClpS
MSIAPAEIAQVVEQVDPDRPWITMVWNDPVNLMSYVTYVFMTYFEYDKSHAESLMMDVHEKGRAVVSNGTREEMERDVAAMHGFGLWATLQKDD